MTNLVLETGSEILSLNSDQLNKLREIVEQGLPINSQPYLAIANQLTAMSVTTVSVKQMPSTAVSEQQVIQQISTWQSEGLIRRFGLVVKHRQLGYSANAMIVWNIDDIDIDAIANQLALRSEISLCYRRPRRLPDWPYNLFCMIHGQSTKQVETQIATIVSELGLSHIDKDILFSHKAYKQHGARYQRQVSA